MAKPIAFFESPAPWTVIQRNDQNQGIANFVADNLPANSATMVLEAWNDKSQLVGSSNAQTYGNVAFAGITLPAGGWYLITINAYDKSGNIVAKSSLWPIGVGEVFITAGQSNSNDCCGESPQATTNPLTSAATFNPSAPGHFLTWNWMVDNFAAPPGGGGGSPWPAFESELAARLGMPVAVIEVGCAGTSVADWVPNGMMEQDYTLDSRTQTFVGHSHNCGPDADGTPRTAGALFNRLVNATKAVGSYRAILWHQGESDMFDYLLSKYYPSTWPLKRTPGQYRADLETIIKGLASARSGQHSNWVVAQASYGPGNDVNSNCLSTGQVSTLSPFMQLVTSDQAAVVRDGLAFSGPNTDVLSGTIPGTNVGYRYPGAFGGCIHFSNEGLTAHGQSWVQAVLNSGIL